jgi:hypothetical protein
MPNNTSRLMKAMADRSRGHRGAITKRKKSHKIVGDKHKIVAACGQALRRCRSKRR